MDLIYELTSTRRNKRGDDVIVEIIEIGNCEMCLQEAEFHETGDFILRSDCQELTFTPTQHYEKDIMIRLSKLSHYEYLITKYHMDKGMGPAKLDWLDNLRQMTRREQQLMNDGMSQQEIATHFDLITQARGSWMVLPPYFIR